MAVKKSSPSSATGKSRRSRSTARRDLQAVDEALGRAGEMPALEVLDGQVHRHAEPDERQHEGRPRPPARRQHRLVGRQYLLDVGRPGSRRTSARPRQLNFNATAALCTPDAEHTDAGWFPGHGADGRRQVVGRAHDGLGHGVRGVAELGPISLLVEARPGRRGRSSWPMTKHLVAEVDEGVAGAAAPNWAEYLVHRLLCGGGQRLEQLAGARAVVVVGLVLDRTRSRRTGSCTVAFRKVNVAVSGSRVPRRRAWSPRGPTTCRSGSAPPPSPTARPRRRGRTRPR